MNTNTHTELHFADGFDALDALAGTTEGKTAPHAFALAVRATLATLDPTARCSAQQARAALAMVGGFSSPGYVLRTAREQLNAHNAHRSGRTLCGDRYTDSDARRAGFLR